MLSKAATDDLVVVGHIYGTYGLQGWVRIKPYSPDADALLHAKKWWLDKPDFGDVERLQAKKHGEDVVAQLIGVVDCDAAALLKGSLVRVARSDFPLLDEGEFYWCDLVGLQVENLDGQFLGLVVGLMDNGAHPIIRVKIKDSDHLDNQEERLIPFVNQFIKLVDQQAGKIVVDWDSTY